MIERKKMTFTNKVDKKPIEFHEDVKEFTGLIFHCPNCEEVFHLYIATVRVHGGKVKKE